MRSPRPSRRRLLLVCGAAFLAAGARFAPPEDVLEVSVSGAGFRPQVVHARKGEVLRLKLTTADAEHCFAVDAFRVEKRITRGRVTSVEITPDKAGTFPFHCCVETGAAAEKEAGQLVVSE